MTQRAPRTYDELTPAPPWPLSRLYHENSKLTERHAAAMREQIERFADAAADPPQGAPAAGGKVYPSRPSIHLPRSRRPLLGARLDDTLRERRTQRGPFAKGGVDLRELATLLHLSLGITAEATPKPGPGAPLPTPLRSYPSAGGLHPLEVYVAALACHELDRGIYHHDPARRALALVAPCPARADLGRLVLADDLWENAAAALVFTAVFDRTQAKYGERGYRFALIEAGHAAQNVLLVARSLRLAAAPIGGFCEDALGDAMGLDRERESPIYVVLLGR